MSKSIETLVDDMYEVVLTKGGWDATITEFFSSELHDAFAARFEDDGLERSGGLRMSNMGTPCQRKLWYTVNTPNEGESLAAPIYLKFLFGDMLEVLLLSLAKAAGHDVAGCQDELSIAGIVGHRDAVIDGVTIDVKSASPYSFLKFKDGSLRSSDPFGYVSQLSSYVYAGSRADESIDATRGGFLVVNKVSGELCLDLYDFSDEIANKEQEFLDTIEMSEQPDPPDRAFEPLLDGYTNNKKQFVPNGNEYLSINCSYCEFKKQCWPGLRTFLYRKGNKFEPKFLTHVAKEPKVQEVT